MEVYFLFVFCRFKITSFKYFKKNDDDDDDDE